MEQINNLRRKILQAYLGNNLNILSIIDSDLMYEPLTTDEKEYVSKKMILKIEDITEKEKAIASVLKLLGEENMELNFEESEERKERIKILGEILIFIQE